MHGAKKQAHEGAAGSSDTKVARPSERNGTESAGRFGEVTVSDGMRPRLREIRTRFEVLRRDAEIDCLKCKLAGEDPERADAVFEAACQELEEDYHFIVRSLLNGKSVEDADEDCLRRIEERCWTRNFQDTVSFGMRGKPRDGHESGGSASREDTLLGDFVAFTA